MPEQDYTILQGKFYIAERNASTGAALGFRFVGNVPEASIALEEQTIEHTESYTGKRLVDKVVGLNKRGMLNITMEEYTKENLVLAMRGTLSSVSAATITNESHVAYKNSFIKLNNIGVSQLTATDNATPTPTTLVAGTDYVVDDAAAGIIFIPQGSTLANAATIRFNYTTAANSDKITAFSQTADKDFRVLFSGKNQADDLKPVTIEVFKVRFPPIGSLELITNEFGTLDLQAMIQYDSLNLNEGGFFRVFKPI